jgi:hypothetical protein
VFWLNRIGALVEGAVTHVRLAQKSGPLGTRDPKKRSRITAADSQAGGMKSMIAALPVSVSNSVENERTWAITPIYANWRRLR